MSDTYRLQIPQHLFTEASANPRCSDPSLLGQMTRYSVPSAPWPEIPVRHAEMLYILLHVDLRPDSYILKEYENKSQDNINGRTYGTSTHGRNIDPRPGHIS